jgi:hypothetical protein
VVRYADKAPEVQLVNSGFFLDFTHGADFDVFACFLMAFRQVPEAVTGDKQEVAPSVADKAAGGIHLLEFCTDSSVCAFYIGRWNIDSGKGILHLEHAHEGVHVHSFAYVEFHGVGIGQGFFRRGANNDTPFLEIYFVHDFCYICVLQR